MEFLPQDSQLIKDIKRLWPIHTVQTSTMQYAFGVQIRFLKFLKIHEIFNKILEFFCFVFVSQYIHTENMLTIEIEDGREAS